MVEFNVACFLWVCAPALCMLVGSLAVFVVKVSPQVQAVFQMFSAGLLVTAVGNELFPLMQGEVHGEPHKNNNYKAYLALTAGLALGLVFMYGLKMVFEEDEDDEAPEAEEGQSEENPASLTAPCEDDHSTRLLRTGSGPPPGSWFKSAKRYVNSSVALDAFKADSDRLEEAIDKIYEVLDRPQNGGGGSKRNLFDEALHVLMGRLDTARRHIFKVKKFTDRDQLRIRHHMSELCQNLKELQAQTSVDGLVEACDTFEQTLEHIHLHAHNKNKWALQIALEAESCVRNRRWAAPKESADNGDDEIMEELSLTGAVAVTVDAMVDGLLIGLAYIASHTAGISMAIATCIEMGFLGVAFSNQVKASTNDKLRHFTIVAIPPVALVAAGIVGDILGQELVKQEYVFIGFIAFATVALLFLVVEELLTEANEVSKGAFTINVCFFLGLYAGLIMDKALG